MARVDDVRLHIGELDLTDLDVDGEVVQQALIAEIQVLLAHGHVLPDSGQAKAHLGTATVQVERWESPVDLGRQIARRLVGDVRRGWVATRGEGSS